jgi:uncharacterized membrane protein YphA (DoxX/SURF4 family)
LRVALGLVMALEAYSLCRPSAMMQGRIPLQSYFIGPDIQFHLPYEGFTWLPMLPAPWLYAVVAILALAGILMALGFCYRASAGMVFLTFGYLFTVESTRTYWQSYYYIELLFSFLLVWMPAARRYSIDAWLARGRNAPQTVPFWTIFLLRGQLVIAYFYAGVSKLNLDWLLDAAPVRWDLAEAHFTTDLQPYLTAAQFQWLTGVLHSPQLAYFIAYAGVAFDLAVGFLFLIRRTRMFALILMILFHATNHFVIYANIDWFPLVGVTTALIFLDPDWPARLWNWLRRGHGGKPAGQNSRPAGQPAGGPEFSPAGSLASWLSDLPAFRPAGLLAFGPAPFVVLWLAWQALLPLRHYLIPGDARMTYEGLSFSWRLKADDHRALSVQMFVDDPAIVSRDDTGRMRIDWAQWHGDKVIYRRIKPGGINWAQLPEIIVLLEPLIGERVVYNPLAGSPAPRSEAESRQRVQRIWQELYGRQPQNVRAAVPLSQVLQSVSTGLSAAGLPGEAGNVARFLSPVRQFEQGGKTSPESAKWFDLVRQVFSDFLRRDERGEMLPYLRTLPPFALEGETSSGSFLLIEDPALFEDAGERSRRIKPAVWRNGSYSGGPRSPRDGYAGGEPLVIHMSDIGGEARDALPLASILDSQDYPDRPPYILWNSLKDLPSSKLMHISNQAFYLRRYARRIASLWEADYGRRPAVRARTAVSLNARPYQLLVDPDVDLASVSVQWFGHNSWIRDLEMPRIPREALRDGAANRFK